MRHTGGGELEAQCPIGTLRGTLMCLDIGTQDELDTTKFVPAKDVDGAYVITTLDAWRRKDGFYYTKAVLLKNNSVIKGRLGADVTAGMALGTDADGYFVDVEDAAFEHLDTWNAMTAGEEDHRIDIVISHKDV
jgi:hypothetical protein